MLVKKLVLFIALSIFLLIFFIHPKKVVAGELDCTATGVSGAILNEDDQSVGAVWLGLTGGGTLNSTDGSFTFSGGYFGQVNQTGELKLSYNFPNDSPYESGNVILPQCLGNAIHVKLKVEPEISGEYKRNLCGKSCSDNPKRCEDSSGGCTVCTYRYNAYLATNQSWHCEKPEAKEAEKTELKEEKAVEENKVTQTEYEVPDLPLQINKIVNYSMGIGGIIAFLLIVFGGFQIILSAGNPDRVKAGKEMITSAIAGLLLIIFAVFILRLIGYDILRIPEFEP